MKRYFNVTGLCIPEKHYMVDTDNTVKYIIENYIQKDAYFTINRARQYGKTTTLELLRTKLQDEYVIIDISFEGKEDYFTSLNALAEGLFFSFKTSLSYSCPQLAEIFNNKPSSVLPIQDLSEKITTLCNRADKKVILMVDEVDKAADNQTFLSFLGMLRNKYLERQKGRGATFSSVILAGVHDIKNLKIRLRPEESHSYNSPWNIAADFNVDMSFSAASIAGMLNDYEVDHNTGMNTENIAQLIYDYTSGYPFLVSRICKLIDEQIGKWTKDGIEQAVKVILNEKNTLFDDINKKLADYPELKNMIYRILFNGCDYAYNPDNAAIEIGLMFGLISNNNGTISISNRIFETRLYNSFLIDELGKGNNSGVSVVDKNMFVKDNKLDMDLVMSKFLDYFTEIYADSAEKFIEENGRRLFLLYLKPIINGIGNYYIEARTRNMRRTDVIVDYNGIQYIIEMKIWHGDEYNRRGESQLVEYLGYYGADKGYLLSFNFNKGKETGIKTISIGEKTIVEVVV